MKAFTRYLGIAAVAGTFGLPASASAQTFLDNWYLDINKDGDKVQVSQYLDFVGASYIKTTTNPGDPSSFTFTDNGFFVVQGHDGGASIQEGAPATWSEMTAMFTGATGSGTFGGPIDFDPGANLKLYSDSNFNYSSTDGVFGANDGTLIGEFELVDGSGIVDPNGVPNGQLTLIFKALSLTAGYWFAPDGSTDLSTLVPGGLLFGFVTTNASYNSNPSATLNSEMAELLGVASPLINTPPQGFFIANNGQYRLDPVQGVPEPGVLALFGLGMLGLGLNRSRRTN